MSAAGDGGLPTGAGKLGRAHNHRIDRVASAAEVRAFFRAWDAVQQHRPPPVGSLFGAADERASATLAHAADIARRWGGVARPMPRHIRAALPIVARLRRCAAGEEGA